MVFWLARVTLAFAHFSAAMDPMRLPAAMLLHFADDLLQSEHLHPLRSPDFPSSFARRCPPNWVGRATITACFVLVLLRLGPLSRRCCLASFFFFLASSLFTFDAVLSLEGAKRWLLASAVTLAVHIAIALVCVFRSFHRSTVPGYNLCGSTASLACLSARSLASLSCPVTSET